MKTGYIRMLTGGLATLLMSFAGMPSWSLVFANTGTSSATSLTQKANAGAAKLITSPAAAYGTQWPQLVALGDSITFGYNLFDTHGNTAPSQFAFPEWIGKDDLMHVTNLAVPGWRSADLLSALSSPEFVRVIQSADVITIDIGSNDLLANPAATQLLNDPTILTEQGKSLTAEQDVTQLTKAVTTFGTNLQAIMKTVRGLTKAPILLYNLYNPFLPGTELNLLTGQLEADENAQIELAAQSYRNVTLVDAHAAFVNRQQEYVRVVKSDIHPTVLGQYQLAKMGEEKLLPYLGQIFKK